MKGNNCIKISRIEEREFGLGTVMRTPVYTKERRVNIISWWSSNKRNNLRKLSWAIFKK